MNTSSTGEFSWGLSLRLLAWCGVCSTRLCSRTHLWSHDVCTCKPCFEVGELCSHDAGIELKDVLGQSLLLHEAYATIPYSANKRSIVWCALSSFSVSLPTQSGWVLRAGDRSKQPYRCCRFVLATRSVPWASGAAHSLYYILSLAPASRVLDETHATPTPRAALTVIVALTLAIDLSDVAGGNPARRAPNLHPCRQRLPILAELHRPSTTIEG